MIFLQFVNIIAENTLFFLSFPATKAIKKAVIPAYFDTSKKVKPATKKRVAKCSKKNIESSGDNKKNCAALTKQSFFPHYTKPQPPFMD
jgi:hypothetical protein